MRRSRELGVALLLMLGASGCAGVQQRTGWTSTGSDGSAQASTSGWFGSRWWRPAPTEATRQGGEIAPEYQAAKKNTAETNIWPENPPPSRLSRLFTRFGRKSSATADQPGLIDGDSQDRGLRTTARPPAAGRGDDRQVQPVAAMRNEGDPQAGGTAPRSAAALASQDVPPTLTSPIAVAVPDKPYDRPAFQGNVALPVAQADLSTGDAQAGAQGQQDSTAGQFELDRPKRESFLIPTAGGAADVRASETEEPAQATQGQGQTPKAAESTPPPIEPAPSATPPPAMEPAQTAPRTRPAQPPAGTARPGTTRPAAPAQQPASPPARRPAPATRTPQATMPAPPAAAPAPVPAPARTPVETTPPETPPAAAPEQQPPPAATAQQFYPGAGVTPIGSYFASPQSESGGCDTAAKPPKKPCWLKTWIHSLHHQREADPGPFASPQLPAAMFPTTYQTCKPGQKNSCQPAVVTVQPTLQQTQSVQPAQQIQTKKCFAWIGKGPVTCLVKKLKKLGSGCRCHCHCCPEQAVQPACGGSCATGNCGTGIIVPSSQVWPVSYQAQPRTSLLDAEPRDVTQGSQVLERIATQGLDKTPQR